MENFERITNKSVRKWLGMSRRLSKVALYGKGFLKFCKLCTDVGSLKHILSGCKTSLSQGCFMWRHNLVLKSLTCLFENKLVEVNSSLVIDRDRRISFVQEGPKSGHQECTNSTGKAQDWSWLADVRRQLQVPKCIVVAAMRPDMVLYSECECIVYFIELMIPFEDAIEEAFERKKLKYAELVAEAREQGWQAHTRPVEDF